MKRIFFIFSMLLCCILSSCTDANNTSSNRQEYQNNATDDMFTISEITTGTRKWFSIDIKNNQNKEWGTIKKRKSGNTGIIGEWLSTSEYSEDKLIFNDDGTFEDVYTKSIYSTSSNNYIRTNGHYEIYESNGKYRMKIKYSNKEYDFEYLVSDSYFCPERNDLL